ncbi:MAG TPA: hypothetical protein DCM40_32875 [Maribacter sp.]|nr:hypothetical protein [Maribacter sp.]|tara:strand:+ start:81 stop:299 length:219 start_codon:yes stop_codon:yes gene_type:complete
MAKEYDIGVWDIQFYKVDKNGMELQNPDGSVKLFQLKEDDKLDIGYNFFIREFVEISNIKENELVEIPNEPN